MDEWEFVKGKIGGKGKKRLVYAEKTTCGNSQHLVNFVLFCLVNQLWIWYQFLVCLQNSVQIDEQGEIR